MGTTTTWTYDDGGREAAGYRGSTGDCTVRAIAIATEQPYDVVYEALFDAGREWYRTARKTKRMRGIMARFPTPTPRRGVYPEVYRRYLEQTLGWVWTPTMRIGSGTTVHLRGDELPGGRLVANCSKHLVAVVNGVVHDTYDSTRKGKRAVYGYWQAPAADVTHERRPA